MTDLLSRFLISCTSTPSAPLLPPPADDNGKGGAAGTLTKRSSGRLASKPTAGLSTMDKVQFVLLKKSGVLGGDAPSVVAAPADLEKYWELYKRPLPDNFIAAIESMLDATGPIKQGNNNKGGGDRCRQSLPELQRRLLCQF